MEGNNAMIKRILCTLSVLVLIFSMAAPASATLTVIGQGTITAAGGRGGGLNQTVDLVYSSLLDVTILNFSNFPDTWANQVDWADQLVVDFGGTTLDNWRLPETFENTITLGGGTGWEGDPDGDGIYNYQRGYNMDLSSEMARLYYDELGNLGFFAEDGTNPQPGVGLSNTAPLTALVEPSYWSGTEYSPDSGRAWGFFFADGLQNSNVKNGGSYALAVLPGNPVPVPSGLLLLMSGAGCLVCLRKSTRR
jgi:hypothetical protein